MVGKMNSRWQSDNPVRSIGEYLPLRQRCTHAALTHRNTRPMYAETRLYYTWRRDTLMYRQVCTAPRTCMWIYALAPALTRVFRACTYTCGRHIETRLPARLRKWEEERTCTMHESVYIHTGPSWIYSRRNFATRGDERGMREEERKEFSARYENSRTLPAARVPTADGVVKGSRIFDFSHGMRMMW